MAFSTIKHDGSRFVGELMKLDTENAMIKVYRAVSLLKEKYLKTKYYSKSIKDE